MLLSSSIKQTFFPDMTNSIKKYNHSAPAPSLLCSSLSAAAAAVCVYVWLTGRPPGGGAIGTRGSRRRVTELSHPQPELRLSERQRNFSQLWFHRLSIKNHHYVFFQSLWAKKTRDHLKTTKQAATSAGPSMTHCVCAYYSLMTSPRLDMTHAS